MHLHIGGSDLLRSLEIVEGGIVVARLGVEDARSSQGVPDGS